jgi:Flp pilus assembly protein TadD
LTSLRERNVSDGYLAQANRFVHGYFTGSPGNLRFEIEVEDTSRHKFSEAPSENGNLLTAMNAAAKRIAPEAHPFPASDPEAVQAWGRGEYERAVTLDPDFGAAWLAWAEGLQRTGDSARAIEVASRALARSSLRSELDRARIELFSADEHHDTAAREQALSELARLAPSDTAVLTALAEASMNARHFRDAAAHYRDLQKLEPSNAAILNSLGYAEAFAGDLVAARKAFEEYGRAPGQQANSLDSLGEVHFMRGKFAEAEKYFLAAHQSDPALMAGEDLLKAAYAHWLGSETAGSGAASSGNNSAADALTARYLEFRRERKDPLVTWREASWLYATSRREQAIAKLASIPADQKPERQLADRQLALWDGKIEPPHDVDALKQKFETTTPSADSQVRVLYAAALITAGRKDEARPLLELWPMPWTPGDPLLESWVLTKFVELRAAVGVK